MSHSPLRQLVWSTGCKRVIVLRVFLPRLCFRNFALLTNACATNAAAESPFDMWRALCWAWYGLHDMTGPENEMYSSLVTLLSWMTAAHFCHVFTETEMSSWPTKAQFYLELACSVSGASVACDTCLLCATQQWCLHFGGWPNCAVQATFTAHVTVSF